MCINYRNNFVQYGNRIYSTLADVSRTAHDYTCQSDFLTLPSDWVIAPDNQNSESAIRNDYWSTSNVLTSSGTTYNTLHYGYGSSGSGCCNLYQSGSQYKTTFCAMQILIMT